MLRLPVWVRKTDFPAIPRTALGSARWGNYSAAADGNNLWMAAEFVPGACKLAVYRRDHT
jgi:hypothetical protein